MMKVSLAVLPVRILSSFEHARALTSFENSVSLLCVTRNKSHLFIRCFMSILHDESHIYIYIYIYIYISHRDASNVAVSIPGYEII
jgi:hypothetical protein